MLKSLLVLLNDERRTHSASDLARSWAASHKALAVGLTVLDIESLCGDEPFLSSDMSAKELHDQALLDEARAKLGHVQERFQQSCAQRGIQAQALTEEGRPADVIAREAQRCDLVLVDHPRTPAALGSLNSDQLMAVVKHCPRPLVVVPDRASTATDVVIAYDGNLPAARAVQAFAQSGLAAGREIRVVSAAEEYVAATRRVDRAVDYLQRHDIPAKAVPIVSEEDPAAVILDHLSVYPTGLLVMGTFGQNIVREVLFGSVTRRLIRHCPVPVFLDH